MDAIDTVPDKMHEQYDVMISYSHKDEETMKEIKSALEKAGITVWVDSHLHIGEHFLRKIGEAIEKCSVFVAVLSEFYLESRFCKMEITLADFFKKPIFPVSTKTPSQLEKSLKENPGMALILCGIQWLILSSDKEKRESQFQQLVEAVKHVINKGSSDGNDGQEASNQHKFWSSDYEESVQVPGSNVSIEFGERANISQVTIMTGRLEINYFGSQAASNEGAQQAEKKEVEGDTAVENLQAGWCSTS